MEVQADDKQQHQTSPFLHGVLRSQIPASSDLTAMESVYVAGTGFSQTHCHGLSRVGSRNLREAVGEKR